MRSDPDFTVNDLHLSARQRTAHVRLAVGLFRTDGRGKLGQTVAAEGAYILLSRLFGQFHRDGRPAQQHRFQCDRLVGIKQTPELGWHQRGVGAAAQRLLQRLFLAHG